MTHGRLPARRDHTHRLGGQRVPSPHPPPPVPLPFRGRIHPGFAPQPQHVLHRLDRAERLAPGNPSIMLSRAVLCGRSGSYSQALAILDAMVAPRSGAGDAMAHRIMDHEMSALLPPTTSSTFARSFAVSASNHPRAVSLSWVPV